MSSYFDNKYVVGVYIRLSREDDDKALVSESVSNQKSLLVQYANENNLNIYDYYVDDGYSGTNFDRPAFKRLLKDIELNIVNMVITKDMSRLGRDYVGTGNLIEKYFPEHNVRYIAVTDNIDTFLDDSNNDIAPFKAIMNDMYAKDISKKIRASLIAKMKDGKYVGCRCPYGYMKDLNNKNHLIINKEQAIIVKRIFNMALDGLTYYKIAKILTEEKIKTPALYYNFSWKKNNYKKIEQWHAKTINDILTNKIYTGDLVQHKRKKVNYKVKKIIKVNSNNYIEVKNTHDAIIDKETFNEVQKKLPKNVGRNEKKENHLLDGLLYCGDCGHRISVSPRRKKDNKCYTICNYYRTYINKKYCTTHSNNYDVLESIVIDNLKNICLNYIDIKTIKKEVIDSVNNINLYKNDIDVLDNEIKNINDNLDKIYIDKLNNKISEDQFKRLKEKLNTELIQKKERINYLNKKSLNNTDIEFNNKLIDKYIDEYLTMKNISRELIVNLVDKIIIYNDNKIDLNLTFSKN